MVRKTKEEASKTREQIVRKAEDIFFERGVVRTSLQEIASAAGVTRGAIYWHFRDKVDLLCAIADSLFMPHEELLDRLVAMEADDPLKLLCKNCMETLNAIANDPRRRRVYTILIQRCEYVGELEAFMCRHDACRDRLLDRLASLFEQARKRGILAPVWLPQIAAVALRSFVVGFIHTEMEYEKPSRKRDKERNEAIIAFFHMLRAAE